MPLFGIEEFNVRLEVLKKKGMKNIYGYINEYMKHNRKHIHVHFPCNTDKKTKRDKFLFIFAGQGW